MPQLILTTLPGIPLLRAGDDLAAILLASLSQAGIGLQDDDVLVLASKIVSKVEGRIVALDSVEVSGRAQVLAERTGKDPREVELILKESVEVVRFRAGLLITRHKLGFVSANAGMDRSNVGAGVQAAILLPVDPDASAQRIRGRLQAETGARTAVVIADSHGRPHRMGAVGIAVGSAGIAALEDWRGRIDLFGYVLQHTELGVADMVASAATLLLGQAGEGTPAVHLRGLPPRPAEGRARDLVRPKESDLFP